jgi:hypothetical protein
VDNLEHILRDLLSYTTETQKDSSTPKVDAKAIIIDVATILSLEVSGPHYGMVSDRQKRHSNIFPRLLPKLSIR